MDRGVGALAAALAVVLAGCSGTADPGAFAPDEPGLHEADTSAAGCLAVALLVPTDPVRAARSLPPGFHIRDPRDFVDAPASTGTAGVFVNVFDCQASAGGGPSRFAYVAIFVEHPEVPEVEGTATYDFYVLGFISHESALLDLWAERGWPVRDVAVQAQPSLVPVGATAGTWVHAAAGTLPTEEFSIDLITPAPIPQGLPTLNFRDAVVRTWVDSPSGLGFMEFQFSADVPVGSAYCTFGPDSLAAQALGATSCPSTGNAATFAANFANLAYAGRLVHLEGVHAR